MCDLGQAEAQLFTGRGPLIQGSQDSQLLSKNFLLGLRSCDVARLPVLSAGLSLLNAEMTVFFLYLAWGGSL